MTHLKKRGSTADKHHHVILVDLLYNKSDAEAIVNSMPGFSWDEISQVCGDNRYIVIDKQVAKFEYFNDISSIIYKYKSFKMFSKADRSSFRYWFAHWCGFQLTALNLGIWKFKYLFHDIEKPWLKLWYRGNYKKVQHWHRNHNRHHLEYGLFNGWDNVDWEALMIDWECCCLSKAEAQLDARETMEYEIKQDLWSVYASEIKGHLKPLLDKYYL